MKIWYQWGGIVIVSITLPFNSKLFITDYYFIDNNVINKMADYIHVIN